MKHIIAIIGLPGAGKSQACSFFKQKNTPVIRFGAITTDALREKGLPETQEHEKAFRENLRQELGMAAFAIKSQPKINAALNASDIVVVDGLRSWEEYEYLKEKFEKVYLLAIYASPSLRHQRLSERKERSLSQQEAALRDVAEVVNLHMGPPIALADYLIKNETTIEEFNHQLEEFLKEINSK